jgi:hypothetical protein
VLGWVFACFWFRYVGWERTEAEERGSKDGEMKGKGDRRKERKQRKKRTKESLTSGHSCCAVLSEWAMGVGWVRRSEVVARYLRDVKAGEMREVRWKRRGFGEHALKVIRRSSEGTWFYVHVFPAKMFYLIVTGGLGECTREPAPNSQSFLYI